MWPSGLRLAMTLTLNFQGQVWNLLYLSQKWSDYHEMISKHIDWTPGLKCDQWVWPWPWILKFKCDLDLPPHIWPWPWIFMVRFWNNCISEWEGRLTLHKGGCSRSFMTMTMTILWPRSGVWIYQVVTGVPSVVGVPLTHLVFLQNLTKALGGGWGCKVSCGGHHRPMGKTTTGSALDGAVFDIAQILAYLVHNMSRSQLYLGFGHFGWLPSFFGQ